MKRRHPISALTLALATAWLAVAAPNGQLPKVVVEKTIEGPVYESDIGNRAEVLGVCRLTESELECWDPKGAAKPDLERRLFESMSSSTGFQGVPIRHGYKNRLVVVRTVALRYGLSVRSISSQFPATNIVLSPMLEDLPRDFSVTTIASAFAVERDASKCDVNLTETLIDATGDHAKFKAGEAFSLFGRKCKLGKPTWERRPYSFSAQWTVPIVFEEPLAQSAYVNAMSFDRKGAEIQYVDFDGRPITRQEHERRMANPNGNQYIPIYGGTTFYLSAGSKETRISFSFNPKYIGSLEFSGRRERIIRLTGIPLDPAKPNASTRETRQKN